MQDADFKRRLNKFVDQLWTIQNRISELHEFEDQWRLLFENLKSITGKDCEITIQNEVVYRTFRWDRYQVLLSDLLSICENELDKQHNEGVLRQTINYMKLGSVESYIHPNPKVFFLNKSPESLTTEQKQSRVSEINLANAQRLRNDVSAALKRLFPQFKEELGVTPEDVTALLSTIGSLAKKIRSQRHYFSHKYQETATARYQSSLNGFELADIQMIADQIFQIVSDIGLVYLQTTFASSYFGYKGEISDQLDIMLFGSISRSVRRMREFEVPGENYWESRKRFYASPAIIEFLVPTTQN